MISELQLKIMNDKRREAAIVGEGMERGREEERGSLEALSQLHCLITALFSEHSNVQQRPFIH